MKKILIVTALATLIVIAGVILASENLTPTFEECRQAIWYRSGE